MPARVRLNDEVRHGSCKNHQFHKGRPFWEPAEWQRKMAYELAGLGIPQVEIAKILEVGEVTLTKHMRHELDLGQAEFHAIAARKLFQHIANNNFQALQFYMRVRMGWIEPKPTDPERDTDDVSKLTDEQLQSELDSISTRAATASNARGVATTMS
jgi:hypothetical protein